MLIRAPRDDDFAAIAEITNHYITTTPIHFAYEPVLASDLQAAWAADRARYPWQVAADDTGRVLAFAKAGSYRERAAYAWTTETAVYVHPDARGRGVGRAVYTPLLAEVAARGCRSAIAGIVVPNDASIGLHRTLGFVSVGIVREAGFKLGGWHDIEFMQKLFSAASGS